jgi:hypothetical protein
MQGWMRNYSALAVLLISLTLARAGQALDLPPEVALDADDLGRGLLVVPIQLPNGQEARFLLDTGSPITLIDRSLRPLLGAKGERLKVTVWGKKKSGRFYAAPKLKLNGVELALEPLVASYDFTDLSVDTPAPITGIIGMDCLSKYCLQIDSAARKLRFLESSPNHEGDLGKAFTLRLSNEGQGKDDYFRTYIEHESLIGGPPGNVLVDTGMNFDGASAAAFLEKRAREAGGKQLRKKTWLFPKSEWEGQPYSNLLLTETTMDVAGEDGHVIGMRFLARHLVTLDFPNEKLFLKRTSEEPLPNRLETVLLALASAGRDLPENTETLLNELIGMKKVPWWFRWMGGTITVANPGADSSIRYTVRQKRGPEGKYWQLKEAWRMTLNGKKIEKLRMNRS